MRTNAWSNWPAAVTWPRGCCRCIGRRRTSRRAPRACGRARGPDAGAQLRLRAVPHGGHHLVDAARRAPRHRDERLPVGPARRHERRGHSPSRSRSVDGRCSVTGSGSRSSFAICSRRATTSRPPRAALGRLPYALAHNLTVVDRAGEVLTAYLSPDREPFFRTVPAATNHQGIGGVAGAGARHPHGRARALHPETCSTIRRAPRRRSRRRSSVPRCSARRTRAASGRCTPPHTGRPKVRSTIGGRRTHGASGSTGSAEGEHTEVLAEGSVA